ncbi:conserved Plasmodium protein, unknown function [Plasmodium gallinaceum]|uniref:Uncharacterized protein n=1 Tax=Plasmodium gallinaceum TaxID=5849 RepID=A0A1J1GS94_PLAGA|nr:conserved Plasmodium protein, unknown function [Plasmodium gallinaceum]CRG95150.1 conserved Plasmodium protein, unknown function [Plasmodium gallinaceum]
MNKKDENENILNCKNFKRSFENFNNLDSQNSMYMFAFHKRRHNLDLKDEVKNNYENIEIISGLNRKNKRKLEANFIDKNKKRNFTETQKNFNFSNDAFSNNSSSGVSNIVIDEINDKCIKNSSRNNDRLLSESKIDENKKHSFELAIIPFEGNTSVSDYKYENNITLKNSNLKNIFSFLSKKDIFYKNLKNHIKKNKPLMINCKDFNILLNKYKYENEIGKKIDENHNTLDNNDNYEIENNLINNSLVMNNTIIEPTDLNDLSKNENNFCLKNNDLLNTKLNEMYLDSPINECDINYALNNNNMNDINNVKKGDKFDNLSKAFNTNNIDSSHNNFGEIKNPNEVNYMNNNYNFSNINISNNDINVNNYNLNDNNILNNLNNISFNKINDNSLRFNNNVNFNVLNNQNNFSNLNNDSNLSNNNFNNLNVIDNYDNLNNNYNMFNLSNFNYNDDSNSNENIYYLNNINNINKLLNLNNAYIQNNINNFNNINK